MEFAKMELTAVGEAANTAKEVVIELSELELVLVGGGTGDVHLG